MCTHSPTGQCTPSFLPCGWNGILQTRHQRAAGQRSRSRSVHHIRKAHPLLHTRCHHLCWQWRECHRCHIGSWWARPYMTALPEMLWGWCVGKLSWKYELTKISWKCGLFKCCCFCTRSCGNVVYLLSLLNWSRWQPMANGDSDTDVYSVDVYKKHLQQLSRFLSFSFNGAFSSSPPLPPSSPVFLLSLSPRLTLSLSPSFSLLTRPWSTFYFLPTYSLDPPPTTFNYFVSRTGWFSQRSVNVGGRRLFLKCTMKLSNGSNAEVISNTDWRQMAGPITLDDIYIGEVYNATMETPGWDRPVGQSNENSYDYLQYRHGAYPLLKYNEGQLKRLPQATRIQLSAIMSWHWEIINFHSYIDSGSGCLSKEGIPFISFQYKTSFVIR